MSVLKTICCLNDIRVKIITFWKIIIQPEILIMVLYTAVWMFRCDSLFLFQAMTKEMTLQPPGIKQFLLTLCIPRTQKNPAPLRARMMENLGSPRIRPLPCTSAGARTKAVPNRDGPGRPSRMNNWWLWRTNSGQLGTCLCVRD